MKKNIRLISNFNLDTYYNFLNQKIDSKRYKLFKPDFGLFYDKCFEIINSKNKSYIIFMWSNIDGVISSFRSLMANESINLKLLDKEVDEYINIVKPYFRAYQDAYKNWYGLYLKGIEVTNAWVNFMKKGESNPPHIHHDCHLSSVLFIDIPKPIIKEQKNIWNILKKRKKYTWNYY